jgi:hypothetical protein
MTPSPFEGRVWRSAATWTDLAKAGRRLIYGHAECRAGDKTLTHHTFTYVSVAG